MDISEAVGSIASSLKGSSLKRVANNSELALVHGLLMKYCDENNVAPLEYEAVDGILVQGVRSHDRYTVTKSVEKFVVAIGLETQFRAQFIASQKHWKTSTSLVQVRQRKSEPLRDYLARLNKEALQVRNLNQSVAVTAIQHGLHPSPFNFSISRNPPQTLTALMSHAQKYINTEEALTQLRDEEERSDKRRDTEERKSERSNLDHKKQDRRPNHRPRTPPPNYRNFTSLNMPQSEVLMQIRDRNYIRWPEKMNTQSNKRNHNKYCKFHRDHGHDTENCFNLCNHIEDLIRRGYLDGFIKSEKLAHEERHTKDARPLPRAPPTGVIHVISGGIAAGGESSSGRKKYVRLCEIDNQGHKKKHDQSITFTNDDLRGVQTPNDDTLEIAEVANFKIRRILVDIGSSADVLFEDAFEKLGIDKERLTPVNTPLMGFSEESLLPIGRITLLLLIGDGDITTTSMVDFIVVRCPSSYNAILGRPTLNAL
ncbi:PREDICTED: uncharacterized protein LOC104589244 [Nelumbo nucifera]|uniref:Uncharacterized protein LOC104589244 n=1 Tax=Nelumbo nucifera TaxID=4432 RepID=A0A1U7Z4S9_NELNU|nr:PREDICTED: uncharacterized protein LOC104589244 [Nelumbo nucifera]